MHTKRIAAGYGKKPKWVVTPKGPHSKEESIPLLLIVRDMLGYADNAREAKRIIKDGLVLVDKKPVKDPSFGVGLMDVIEIPKTKEFFRVLPSKKKFALKPIDEKEAKIKPCKVMDKSLLGKDVVQLNLHDGSNILVEVGKYKTRDTIVLELPERKLKEHISFGKDTEGLIVRGRHRGQTGKVGDISLGTDVQKSVTSIGEMQTLTDYIFVIGKGKPLISI